MLSALLVVHSFDSFRTVAGMNITTDATEVTLSQSVSRITQKKVVDEF